MWIWVNIFGLPWFPIQLPWTYLHWPRLYVPHYILQGSSASLYINRVKFKYQFLNANLSWYCGVPHYLISFLYLQALSLLVCFPLAILILQTFFFPSLAKKIHPPSHIIITFSLFLLPAMPTLCIFNKFFSTIPQATGNFYQNYSIETDSFHYVNSDLSGPKFSEFRIILVYTGSIQYYRPVFLS